MALFTKKTWKNRISEYPTRRKLTKENGTTELVTVARSEGTVSQEGDAFSADNMNNLEERISKAIGTGDIPEGLGNDIISALKKLNTDISNLGSVASYDFVRVNGIASSTLGAHVTLPYPEGFHFENCCIIGYRISRCVNGFGERIQIMMTEEGIYVYTNHESLKSATISVWLLK